MKYASGVTSPRAVTSCGTAVGHARPDQFEVVSPRYEDFVRDQVDVLVAKTPSR